MMNFAFKMPVIPGAGLVMPMGLTTLRNQEHDQSRDKSSR